MSLISKLSQASFSLLKFLDETVSLPSNVSRSLDFRNSWLDHIPEDLSAHRDKPSLWIHGASVGELEDLANFYLDEDLLQGSGYSYESLILTSSSASAESFLKKLRARHDFKYAGPLPPEQPEALRKFFTYARPELMLLSHSDLWPLCMEIAQNDFLEQGIIWLPSHRQASQVLLRHIFRSSKLKHVGVRTQSDQLSLESRLGSQSLHPNFHTLGNPRIDRIFQRIQADKKNSEHVLAKHSCAPRSDKNSLIVGSAWLEDAQYLFRSFAQLSADEQNQWQVVVLPHDTSNIHQVASIQSQLPFAKVLSVQGYLLEAYRDFDLAFVGGGFRTGLHSVLEPLSWGLPTMCGPELKQQPDSPFWLEQGSLRSVKSSEEIHNLLKSISDPTKPEKSWKSLALTASETLQQQLGASTRLSQLIKEASLRA